MTHTQPACPACWALLNPGRAPERVVGADEETCCLCGDPTVSGLCVRIDPAARQLPDEGGSLLSLHCEITINGDPIGSVYATRMRGAGTGPDDVNTYDAAVLDAHSITKWFGFVSHRYGDGAWGLVRRVLEAAEEVS